MDPLAERISRIEIELARILPDAVDPQWLARVAGQESPEVSPGWVDAFLEPGRALLRRGGKRWRPLVTVLTCEALGGGGKADVLASLTEIPHNGSLIVDDIEDGSLTRRGGPAIHVEYGTDLAINMGNLMYFLPSLILEKGTLSEGVRAAMTRDWLTVMRRLHLGQGLDIHWHREKELFPDRESYLRMCRYKTGGLSMLAARLGARAALGAGLVGGGPVSSLSRTGYHDPVTSWKDAADVSVLSQVGLPAGGEEALIDMLGDSWESLGTGFQILDDVQNLSSGIPGKDRGDDIVEGKKSLPVILHISRRPGDSGKLAALFAAAAEQAPQGDWSAVEDAIALLNESGSIDEARNEGRGLLDSGLDRMLSLLPAGPARELLADMVRGFREKMV
jgi:octaprenyl-diphosphate synthase